MTAKENIWIGVAWPYANGEQHIGHMAGAYLPADIFARYQRLKGSNVLMVSGSDAHGTPITIKAEQEKVSPQEIVDRYHNLFIDAYLKFGLSFDWFSTTASQTHEECAQKLFKLHLKEKYLYKETQKQLFDKTVSKFLPDRYVEGTCPKCGFTEARGDQCDNCGSTYESTELLNPKSKLSNSSDIEVRDTEHFFFDLGKANEHLKKWLNLPDKKHWRSQVINYAKAQVNSEELRGRPITRDLDWGVKLPLEGFESKRMYVWYEAVIGYLSSTLEWKKHSNSFHPSAERWAEAFADDELKLNESEIIQKSTAENCKTFYFIGKDNVVFHSIMWPAMILGSSKNLPLPYNVPANEYLNMFGRKFSKSRGNIVSILGVLERFQPDAWRYTLTATAPESTDMNFSWDDFLERVNSELVANWGNLVNRVLGFSYKRFDGKVPEISLEDLDTRSSKLFEELQQDFQVISECYEAVNLKLALEKTRAASQKVNQYLSETTPWTLIKTDEKGAKLAIFTALQCIAWLKTMWAPILPFTCQKLHEILGFDGQIFGNQFCTEVKDTKGIRKILSYDGKRACGQWALDRLKPGQVLKEPTALFQKLDPAGIPELNITPDE